MQIAEYGFNDVLVGSELFQKLEISDGDMMSPTVQRKVREIAEYLSTQDDPLFVIGRVNHNKSPHMNNLDYLLSYVQLQKKRAQIEKEKKEVERELSYYR